MSLLFFTIAFYCLLRLKILLNHVNFITSSASFFLNWISWLFLAVLGLCCCAGFPLAAVSGRSSSSRWAGFSLQRLLSLLGTGSRACGLQYCGMWLSSWGSWALEHRFSNCGPGAQMLRGVWDLPGSGIEPVSPASSGWFFTTEPSGKPNFLPVALISIRGSD